MACLLAILGKYVQSKVHFSSSWHVPYGARSSTRNTDVTSSTPTTKHSIYDRWLLFRFIFALLAIRSVLHDNRFPVCFTRYTLINTGAALVLSRYSSSSSSYQQLNETVKQIWKQARISARSEHTAISFSSCRAYRPAFLRLWYLARRKRYGHSCGTSLFRAASRIG